MELVTLSCIILAPLLFLLILKHHLAKKKTYNHPPSPPSLPIIGHLYLIKEPLNQTLQALSAKSAAIRKVLLVTSPAAVNECFTKNDIVFANRPSTLSTKHFSYNYTTISIAPYGDHWRNLRCLAALEIFSPSRITTFTNIRRRELMLLLNEFLRDSKNGGGKTMVDLKSKFIELAFDVLSMTIAGKRYYGENVEDAEEARRVRFIMREMLEYSGNTNLGDLLPFLQWVDFQRLERRFKELMKKLDKFMQDLVNERQEMVVKGECKRTMNDYLLSLQEEEPEYYTDEVLIKGIVMVLLVAGKDTMSISMEWAMSLLLNHPDSIKKIKAEIDANIPEYHLLDEQDLPKLTCLQNVITETLRLYPPVPSLIPHEVSEDCKVGGYDVSKGTMLLVNLWAIHRDPSLWEEPTKFMPDRHEMRKEEGFMLPFGGGRRKCPGGGIATRVLGLTLGTIIQVFEWERVGEDLVDMTAGTGFSIPKVEALEAMCKPRDVLTKHALVVP
ncbi:Cytochrome P450 CYP2 subfamily [Handroanthus impetiginosus]|uniref:Flavonoid-6-hydroxylase n=1 Tax=Handroanthus impetiginosus TaxID=429701 RepID=A0A2G9G1M9_9LAMI|nr:Cytochrome P450 CYP2 subfamily [Handroanthus impetiginosus]